MEEMTVECPKCGNKFDISEAIQEKVLQNLKEQVEKEFQSAYSSQVDELQEQLDVKTKEINKFRKQELELRKMQRELSDKIDNQELDLQRKLDEERKKIANDSREKVEGEYKQKMAEKDLQIDGIMKELNELKKKAEQGSQQIQGEAAELDLEDILSTNFTYDEIEPVGKGVRGADILQRVCTPDGQTRGIIIWESKQTRNWSNKWLAKLKEDQMEAKADLAVIVSAALPEGVEYFDCVGDIWVVGTQYVIGLATVLRESLIQVARARRSVEGKDQKIELLYQYLSGPEFKQRVEMIADNYMTMRKDLEKEKAAITRSWSLRERSIDNVLKSVSGMYGDLQAIIGALLPSIPVLELPEEVR
jgi:hypothetical protein